MAQSVDDGHGGENDRPRHGTKGKTGLSSQELVERREGEVEVEWLSLSPIKRSAC